MMRKILASIIVITHIVSTLTLPEARAMESDNYRLQAQTLASGSEDNASSNADIPINTIGEASQGDVSSTNYDLSAGYTGQVKTNPPILKSNIPYQIWDKGTALNNAFDLDNYFESLDRTQLTYTVTGNTNIAVNIDPTTHIVSFYQPPDFSGLESIKFIAQDPDGNATKSKAVKLLVKAPRNNPPLINLIDDIVANETNLVTITPTANDVDGDAVTFSFSYPFDAIGKWQTDYNDAGEYVVIVTAKDSTGLTDKLEVQVRVSNINRPPVLSPIADITANEGEIVSIYPQAQDHDGDIVIFTFTPPFNSQGKWQTNYTDHGVRTITVTVSDGSLTASQDVIVTINDVQKPPTVSANLSSSVVDKDTLISINVTASDPDGDSMTLKIEKDTEAIVNYEPLTGSYQTNTSFSAIGDHQIKVIVTDSTSLSTSVTLPVEVLDPGVDPTKIRPIEGDFNGDGFTDVGTYNQANGEWKVSLSHNGNFVDRATWLTGFGASTDWVNIGGDFNADGKADVGICNKNTGEFQIALSNGTKFVSQGKLASINEGSSTVPLTGDFNGDGITDIGIYNYSNGTIKISVGKGASFSFYTTWMDNISSAGERAPVLGDFNGDGLTDLALFYKSNGNITVALSDGKKFIDQGTWITGFGTNKNLLAADFNNDGLIDIGYKDDSNGNWYVAISTGSAFQDKGLWQSNFGSGSDNSAMTGDFNGDGVTDIATFNKNNSGLSQWTTKAIDEQIADILVEIDNGIGGKTTIEYTPSTEYANLGLSFTLQVVNKVSRIDTKPDGPPEEVYIQESMFEGGRYDPEDREFRGFRKATVTDPITGNYTETYFIQGLTKEEDPLKGQIEMIKSYEIGGQLISETYNVYENTIGGTEPNIINFVHLKETTSTIYEGLSQLTVRTLFKYDSVGNIIEEFNEGDTSLAGDERHTIVSYASPYEYDSFSSTGFNKALQSQTKDYLGATVDKKSFSYDTKGNLTRQENVLVESPSESPVTSFTYDDYGNTISVTNTNNHIVQTQYETTYHIYPQTISNELGHSISYTYDPKSDLVTSITDANGNTTTTAYDVLYRKVEERNADNQVVTSYSYPDFNTVVTTQLGLVTSEYIDGLGRKYKTVTSGEDGTNPRQVVSGKAFNNRGHLEYESLPHYIDEDPTQIAYIRYEYDIKGRITSITNDFPGEEKDSTTTTSYPAVLTKIVQDPKGNTKTVTTDVYGNNVEVTDYINDLPYTTYYQYDIKNNLTKLTDTNGNITQILYDSLGRKTKLIDPDTGQTRYTYDKMGNLITQTDAKGQVITFAYDALSRVIRKSYSTSDPAATYTYDETSSTNGIGRLTKIEDASGATKYYYDKEGRITRSDRIIDGTTYTFRTGYDILGRITNTTYPDGEVVTYGYDTNSGLLENVKGLSPQGTVPYAEGITYNAKGQMLQLALGNGTNTSYTYGPDQLLSRIYTKGLSPIGAPVPIQDLNYIFDSIGNITSIQDKLTGVTKTYTYDCLNRLLSATNVPNGKGSLGTIFYEYDPIGNITYKSDVGNYTYGEDDAGPHAVTSIRPAYGGRQMMTMELSLPAYGPPVEGAANLDFSYDANGNMISKAGSVNSPFVGNRNFDVAYQYDAENRLKTVTIDGTTTEAYIYNHSGERVKKTDTNGTIIYIGKLYEIKTELSPQGTVPVFIKHIFAGQNRVASLESSLRGSEATEAIYYYHPDHLGSTNKVSNNSGLLVNAIEYTPFGQTATNTLHNGQTVQPTSYLFTGKELDSSGLYYYGARYYDPFIARFITADPTIARPYDSQDLNRYSYCRNNPLVYVDPSGLSWLSKLLGIIAGVFTFFVSGGNVPLAMAAFSAVDAGIAAAQAGANAWQAAGIALASAAAAYVGAQIGSAFGGWVGGGEFGAAVFSGMFAGAAGGATEAALTGGDVVQSALWGGAIGTAAGIIMGGVFAKPAYAVEAPTTSESTSVATKSHGSADSALNVNKAAETSDPIVNDLKVRTQMHRAWKESFSRGGTVVNEQGGWIVRSSNDGLSVQRWPMGSSGSIRPTPMPMSSIASFHTHPYAPYEKFYHQPSNPDITATKAFGLPTYIIDKKGIMRVDPSTGSWKDVVRR